MDHLSKTDVGNEAHRPRLFEINLEAIDSDENLSQAIAAERSFPKKIDEASDRNLKRTRTLEDSCAPTAVTRTPDVRAPDLQLSNDSGNHQEIRVNLPGLYNHSFQSSDDETEDIAPSFMNGVLLQNITDKSSDWVDDWTTIKVMLQNVDAKMNDVIKKLNLKMEEVQRLSSGFTKVEEKTLATQHLNALENTRKALIVTAKESTRLSLWVTALPVHPKQLSYKTPSAGMINSGIMQHKTLRHVRSVLRNIERAHKDGVEYGLEDISYIRAVIDDMIKHMDSSNTPSVQEALESIVNGTRMIEMEARIKDKWEVTSPATVLGCVKDAGVENTWGNGESEIDAGGETAGGIESGSVDMSRKANTQTAVPPSFYRARFHSQLEAKRTAGISTSTRKGKADNMDEENQPTKLPEAAVSVASEEFRTAKSDLMQLQRQPIQPKGQLAAQTNALPDTNHLQQTFRLEAFDNGFMNWNAIPFFQVNGANLVSPASEHPGICEVMRYGPGFKTYHAFNVEAGKTTELVHSATSSKVVVVPKHWFLTKLKFESAALAARFSNMFLEGFPEIISTRDENALNNLYDGGRKDKRVSPSPGVGK